MLTIYDLLEIEEDATKEEIEKAYSRLVFEFRQDIKFDEKTNKENENVVNKLKIAYDILIDDEKRKKYDYQIAQKRAESLLENVSVSKEKMSEEVEEEHKKDNISKNSNSNKQTWVKELKNEENDDLLSKDEKREIRKAAEKEFKNKLKKAKQVAAEEEYREAYYKAYNSYLRKNGYSVKEPWILKRIKKVLILVLILSIIGAILWFTLPIKENLIKLYEENFVIRMLVDFVKTIIKSLKK